MIIVGYITILSYVFSLIFLLGPLMVKMFNGETSRKIIHTMLFMVWVFIDIFFRNTIHQIIIPIIFLLLNSLSFKFKIYKSVERETDNHLGTVYFAIAITIVMALAFFFPALYDSSGVAAFCLTFGDGFAALVGYHFPSRKLREKKSLLGFFACFAASALCLLGFRCIYPVNLSIPAVLIIAAMAAIFELVEKGLDNFTVTLVTFFVGYLLMHFPSPLLFWGLALSVLLFLVVFLSKSITYYGAIMSMVIVFCFTFFGGWIGISFLLLNYFSIFAIGLLRRKSVVKSTENHTRGFLQILINGGFGTLFVILYGILRQPFLLVTAMVSIGGNFIDSVSSDVGTLSSRPPYDFLRRETVPKGLSGGVTMLGTISALVFSVLIGLYIALTMKTGLPLFCVFAALVFLQSILDTVLGSAVQVKYICGICNTVTEHTAHCGSPSSYLRGMRRMDNNAVNLLSSLLITALAAGLTGFIL